MKKILLALVLIIVFAIAAAFLWLKSTAPVYSGTIQTEKVSDSTQVIFDDFGVPHIYAKSGEDAYFALGYVHAQERLFQMEILRRLSRGMLAEILGPKLIPIDKKMLTLGFNEFAAKNAKANFEGQNGEMQKLARAYQKGINSFIDEGTLPIEFTMLGFKPEHFIEEDIYTTLGFMALGFTTAITSEPVMQYIKENFGEDYTKVFEADSLRGSFSNPEMSIKDILASNIIKDFKSFPHDLPTPYWEGSNSWLVSGKRTKSGKSLFANDTHIGYSQPAVWYEAYMEYPGFNMYGYYLAGMPFAIIGHNDNHAWGITIFPMDNMNLYYETINPKNENQYLQGNEWKNFETVQHTIIVKDSANIDFTLKRSKRGPIINDVFSQTNQDNNHAVSLWWTPHHIVSKAVQATYMMNNAKNIKEFENALPNIDILGLNIMYADADNIAWWATGLVLKYPKGFNSKIYNDGANDTLEHEFYDFSRNPRLVNPERGYIITANNSPGVYDSLFVQGYYYNGYRAERIEKLLLEQPKWNIEEMKSIHVDVFSASDLRSTNTILSELDDELLESDEMKALRSWDGNYDLNSIGATIYTRIVYEILAGTFKTKLGDQRFDELLHTYSLKANIENLIQDKNSVWWNGNRALIFNNAVKQSIESLKKQLGDDVNKWNWGKVHQLTHVHAIGRKKPFDKVFNVGPFPKTGSEGVVDKEGFIYTEEIPLKVVSGPALRCFVDFANPDAGIGIIPTGQSGNIMSPHYSDQAQMFVNGEYRPHIVHKKDMDAKNRSLWFINE